jgi:hypothetical protein
MEPNDIKEFLICYIKCNWSNTDPNYDRLYKVNMLDIYKIFHQYCHFLKLSCPSIYEFKYFFKNPQLPIFYINKDDNIKLIFIPSQVLRYQSYLIKLSDYQRYDVYI